ncbi:hypothetical protein [Streptomyces sp. 1222.5]|uniref:hypothetical protein n=1 Tax=Streptomyces sp. 1222.5 TaxID=1881026 RepID=UPI003EBE66A0
MKRIALDKEELSEKAAEAACLESPAERLHAITAVFQECGERAAIYPDPAFVVRDLVKDAVFWFRVNRVLISWEREIENV